jgi:hypothetical protein
MILAHRCDGRGGALIEGIYAEPLPNSQEMAYRRDELELRAGRCRYCNLVYLWPPKEMRLSEAHCPRCGAPLSQTSPRLIKKGYQMFIDKPLGPGAGKRLERTGSP